MSLVKTVEMRVLADAGDAQKKLDELDAKAKDLDGSDIKMRFRVEDGNAKGQLDDLRARADQLGLKDVSIKVRVDGAGRAIADLMAVRREADKGGGILGRLFGGDPLNRGGADGSGGGSGGLGGLLTKSIGLPGPLPAIPAAGLLALVPAAGALVTEAAGLTSGFAAAGAGLGAFGLVAKSTFTAVSAAAQKVQTAQDNYNVAITHGVNPARAYKAEQIAIAKAYAELTPAQVTLSQKIGHAQSSWQSFVASNTSGVAKIMSAGIGLLPKVFSSMQVFMAPTEKALGGIITQLGKGISSGGFKTFLDSLSKITGPAIGSIGTGIGQVAASFGKLITTMSGKDVAHSINIAFGAISGTISAVTAVVKASMATWDSVSHGMSSAFNANLGQVKSVLHSVASGFDEFRHGAAAAVAGVLSYIGSIPGKIKGDFSGAAGWLVSAGSGIISGLGQGAKNDWTTVTGWLSGLGGNIKGFFAGSGGWLVSAGASIVQGLISGIESQAGSVGSALSRIAGEIRSFLPFSPAKKGPLSGQGSPQIAGQKIIQGLVLGLQGGQAEVTAAAQLIAASVVKPFTSAAISGTIGKLTGMVGKSGLGYDQKLLLTAILERDNGQLQALAARRAALEKQVVLSEQVAQSEIQAASVMNASAVATSAPADAINPITLIQGMQAQRDQIRQFLAQIMQLRRMGLNATSLSQIIGAGASGGLPVAQSLTSGGGGVISQVNQIESQIRGAAGKLGDAAAPSLYAAGAQAARGLAQGIRSQLGAVDSAIRALANQIVSSIRHALKIHSPSLVMAEIAAGIPQGVALGIDRGAHVAVGASARLAASTVQPWGHGGGGHGGGGGIVYNINIHGVTDKQGAAREIQQLLREYKRNGGGAALGIA